MPGRTVPDDHASRDAYRHAEDACLDRTADGLDFAPPTADEAAAAAHRRVDPLRRILHGLLRRPGRDR